MGNHEREGFMINSSIANSPKKAKQTRQPRREWTANPDPELIRRLHLAIDRGWYHLAGWVIEALINGREGQR
jgi:hypothetical protein